MEPNLNQQLYTIASEILKKFKVKHYFAEAIDETTLKTLIRNNTIIGELSIGKIADVYVLAVKTNNDDVQILGSSNAIPAGAKSIQELLDVEPDATNSATSGQILMFNGTKWDSANLNIPDALDELSDVTINSPINNQVLKYNGTNWVNDSLPTPTVPTLLKQLSDVADIDPTVGKVLTYKSGQWQPADIVDNSADLSGISFSITPFPISTALSSSSQVGSYQSFMGIFKFTAPWTGNATGIRIFLPNSVASPGIALNYAILESNDVTPATVSITHGSIPLNNTTTNSLSSNTNGSLVSMPFNLPRALVKNQTYWVYLRIADGTSGSIGGRSVSGQSIASGGFSPVYIKAGNNQTVLELTSTNIPGQGSAGFLPYFEVY